MPQFNTFGEIVDEPDSKIKVDEPDSKIKKVAPPIHHDADPIPLGPAPVPHMPNQNRRQDRQYTLGLVFLFAVVTLVLVVASILFSRDGAPDADEAPVPPSNGASRENAQVAPQTAEAEEARQRAEAAQRATAEAEEARQRAEAAQRATAEAEEARQRAEAAQRATAEAEEARQRAEAAQRATAEAEEARRRAEAAQRATAEAEEARQRAEAAQRATAEAEEARQRAEAAQRATAEAEEARQRAEAAQRATAEAEEARQRAEAAQRATAEAEEARQRAEAAQRATAEAEEARQRAEAAQRATAEAEEARRRAARPSIALSRASFQLPGDGIRNNNQAIGPFCCTGETAIVESEGHPVGYAYFYGWDGQAYNTDFGSVAPDIKILVSGLADLADFAPPQQESSIAFTASEMVPGASRSTTAGGLKFTITIEEVQQEILDDQLFFDMDSVAITVDVSVIQ